MQLPQRQGRQSADHQGAVSQILYTGGRLLCQWVTVIDDKIDLRLEQGRPADVGDISHIVGHAAVQVKFALQERGRVFPSALSGNDVDIRVLPLKADHGLRKKV